MAKIGEKAGTPSGAGNPDASRYDQMQVMLTLMEIQKDIAAQSTKIERLIHDRVSDNSKLEASIKSVSDDLGPVKVAVNEAKNAVLTNRNLVVGGFAVGCAALVVIGYLVGDDIKALLAFAHTLAKS